MKYFSTVSLAAILSLLVSTVNGQGNGRPNAKKVDLVLVIINTPTLSDADKDFFLAYVGAEGSRLNDVQGTGRHLDGSSNLRGSNDEKNQNHRELLTCKQCLSSFDKSTCYQVRMECGRRERELEDIFNTTNTTAAADPFDWSLYDCIQLGGEGRRSINAAAAAKGSAPAHVFGPNAGPDDTEEYYCYKKP